MLSERVKDWTKDWKQQGIEEGKQIGIQEGKQIGIREGRQEGRQEGRLEGEVEFFLKLLERKFGSIDEITRARIRSVDSRTLLHWGERILTAQTIEEVFVD